MTDDKRLSSGLALACDSEPIHPHTDRDAALIISVILLGYRYWDYWAKGRTTTAAWTIRNSYRARIQDKKEWVLRGYELGQSAWLSPRLWQEWQLQRSKALHNGPTSLLW